MKVTELMIGDWYYWEAEGKKYPLQVTKETFALADEDIANFQPVPLTTDILEKNGYFTSDNPFDLPNFVIQTGVEYCEGIVFLGIDVEVKCKYVHQLQHIFKDLQIEKDIVL